MATIIIAEKNKAAEAIANAIGSVKVINKTKSLKIYSIPSKNIYVVPLRGHLLEYRNTSAYKSWTKSNPREIITKSNAIKKYPAGYAAPYINALKEYSKISNHCIIGTDADIEGCNIGLFDALPQVKKTNPNIKVSQIWLSSLQPNEIVNKLNNLIAPKFSWGESGEARAIIDAIIGFSATREVSNTLRPLLNKFGVTFTSIGRVQTSLLYLIYLKEKNVEKFIPELYYLIDAVLIHAKGTFKAHHLSNPFKKKAESQAQQIFQDIQKEKIAKVVNKSKKPKKRSPPIPLNTSKALILLTKNLKIPANTALKTMNALYLNKIISYPRTDSDVYKTNFNHTGILHKFTSHSQFGTYSSSLVKKGRIMPTKGKKDAGDHPPITPLESVEVSSTRFENKLQESVYNLLARHYLALFGEDAQELTQILDLLIKDEPFRAQRVSLISKGFLTIAPFLKPSYEEEIQISSNQIPIKQINLNQKETQPPPRYTDTSLLKLMEKNHLGTKSTRPQIISILQKRQVIKKVKYKYFITDLGKFIINNLVSIWLPFLKPDFTKMIEEKLDDIKEKRDKMHNVVYEIRIEFLKLFDKFLAKKHALISKVNNFKMSYKTPQTSSKCPNCKKFPMKFINLKTKRFLVCSDDSCKSYLSLPKKGKLKLLDSKCSFCNFNIFKVSLQKGKKLYNYYLCPKCWNDGFTDNLKTGKGFCSNCKEFKISKGQCMKK
ncbi:MAG: DNA topoisomerase [Promethearchaeota archaeon]|jgi:DNA topoisomerase-1